MNNKNTAGHVSRSSHSDASNMLNHLEALSLHELMRLATQFHMGLIKMKTSRADMNTVVKLIKERAASELDEGDGMKYETVRVERKLDGSVLIFFGM